jgi:predicted transcriptional regulator
MPRIRNTRKVRFQAALIRIGMTQADWAKQNGMVREHLNRVLNGHIESRPVFEKIDAFVADVEAKVLAA